MNMRGEILKEHSKRQTTRIAAYIGDNPELFAELMQLFLNGSYRITQRAAWIVEYCAGSYPELIEPYLKDLLVNLQNPVHDAVKRNTLKILEEVDIPESLLGLAADVCFRFLNTPAEAVAIRVYAMSVLGNICKKEPDLKDELRLCIESQLPFSSAAFSSRAGKVLKQLEKLPV